MSKQEHAKQQLRAWQDAYQVMELRVKMLEQEVARLDAVVAAKPATLPMDSNTHEMFKAVYRQN
jgi:uncharacterized small protein (DUF1192 family)